MTPEAGDDRLREVITAVGAEELLAAGGRCAAMWATWARARPVG